MRTPKPTVAFVYRWTELSTRKWYIDLRARVSCHPNDGYLCSSRIVKPLIKENPADWHREILITGEPTVMRRQDIGSQQEN